ncbi:expressed unknown protein [Seminavis robusta]|uniref:Uncharacterized protein n=1 Tax=Seminavis robusta TaxID=568900 RepID=A0A9N8HCZ4_9STRA|nr:expressed unknown protein [Seminavis robusta]|eukprot:Sro239_g095780.1 n/a (736) ;mRNA; f:16493-18700
MSNAKQHSDESRMTRPSSNADDEDRPLGSASEPGFLNERSASRPGAEDVSDAARTLTAGLDRRDRRAKRRAKGGKGSSSGRDASPVPRPGLPPNRGLNRRKKGKSRDAPDGLVSSEEPNSNSLSSQAYSPAAVHEEEKEEVLPGAVSAPNEDYSDSGSEHQVALLSPYQQSPNVPVPVSVGDQDDDDDDKGVKLVEATLVPSEVFKDDQELQPIDVIVAEAHQAELGDHLSNRKLQCFIFGLLCLSVTVVVVIMLLVMRTGNTPTASPTAVPSTTTAPTMNPTVVPPTIWVPQSLSDEYITVYFQLVLDFKKAALTRNGVSNYLTDKEMSELVSRIDQFYTDMFQAEDSQPGGFQNYLTTISGFQYLNQFSRLGLYLEGNFMYNASGTEDISPSLLQRIMADLNYTVFVSNYLHRPPVNQLDAVEQVSKTLLLPTPSLAPTRAGETNNITVPSFLYLHFLAGNVSLEVDGPLTYDEGAVERVLDEFYTNYFQTELNHADNFLSFSSEILWHQYAEFGPPTSLLGVLEMAFDANFVFAPWSYHFLAQVQESMKETGITQEMFRDAALSPLDEASYLGYGVRSLDIDPSSEAPAGTPTIEGAAKGLTVPCSMALTYFSSWSTDIIRPLTGDELTELSELLDEFYTASFQEEPSFAASFTSYSTTIVDLRYSRLGSPHIDLTFDANFVFATNSNYTASHVRLKMMSLCYTTFIVDFLMRNTTINQLDNVQQVDFGWSV